MSQFPKPRLPSNIPRPLLGDSVAERTAKAIDVRKKFEESRQVTPYLLGLSDATGSMTGLWDATKRHIQEMIRRLAEIGPFQVRWAAYRDYCNGDALLLEKSNWHDSVAPLMKFLDSIACVGGDDFEEAVEHALAFAVQEPKATRIILIGDAPPHPERDYKKQARLLGEMHRPVFAFVVGNHAKTTSTFREISELSGGQSTSLTSADDLLDLVVLTVAQEVRGAAGVEDYLRKYAPQLSDSARSYGRLLLGRGSSTE